MKNNEILICDGYKLSHGAMYPKTAKNLHSVLYARGHIAKQWKNFVWDKQLIEQWILPTINAWFDLPTDTLYQDVKKIAGENVADIFVKQVKYVKSLKTNPLDIKIAKTNHKMDFMQPLITIELKQDDPKLVWLVNFFETYILQNIWFGTTVATITRELRAVVDKYAKLTCEDTSFTDYQLHDFSARGLSCLQASIYSGQAHLLFSKGTDTIYVSNTNCTIPASEHSVMMAGGKENEQATFIRLMDTFKTGPLAIVSDTWDLWNVCDNILFNIRDKILQRDGKIIIRPDSGNPLHIVCGKQRDLKIRQAILSIPKEQRLTHKQCESIGVIGCLERIFSTTTNRLNYKTLCDKIGIVYGDGMTIATIQNILSRLNSINYASNNIVFGVGAYTYQYNTRDTLGFVFKSTAIKNKDGQWVSLIKDPITDTHKKSLTGRFKI